MDVTTIAISLGVLIPSVILHEIAHGVVALHFGDDTARQAGRLTLNPVPHIDPFGSVILPALLAVTSAGVLGWAKPVPVDRSRLRRPRDHGLIVSLAGPATNIVLAVAAALALRLTAGGATPGLPGGSLLTRVLVLAGLVNVVLAAFNLLPVPPLDGSAVVERLLPRRWLPRWRRLRRYSMVLVLGLVLLLPGAVSWLYDAALGLWSLLLT